MTTDGKPLYSLIPLEDFKAVMGIDDRDDSLARFCIVTGTYIIEQFCRRRLLQKTFFERIAFNRDLFLPLREYPVTEVLAVYWSGNREHGTGNTLPCGYAGELIEPDFYHAVPDYGVDVDLPCYLSLSPALRRAGGSAAFKVVYRAGYEHDVVPADLLCACLELASWNFNRYRGRRVGMTGNVRGVGKEGEHFEMSMPENVKELLEPYRRKMI